MPAPPWLPELEKWEASEYDGIKGVPPSWVPYPQKKDFYGQRFLLFQFVREGRASYTEIKLRFDDLVTQKRHAIVLALLKDCKPYDEPLRACVRLFKVASLPPAEGLKVLAGEDAARGFLTRTGYRHRREFVDKPAVRSIASQKWRENTALTIKEIIHSPEVACYPQSEKTKREWISDLDPRPTHQKQGRPSKRK